MNLSVLLTRCAFEKKGIKMEKEKGFDARGLIVRAVLAVVTLAIGLGLAGCGEQMARIEENQLRLQTMAEANAQQIAAIAARIEQNQHELQAGLEDVRNSTKGVANEMAVLENEQLKLQEIVQNDSQQLANTMAAVEQNQYKLQAGIEDIESGTKQVAVEVGAVGDEQIKLQEVVHNNGRQLAGKVALIEQSQAEWQGRIQEMQENVQKVAAGMTALGANLLRLQNTLQDNMRELVGIMEVAGQDQLNFEKEIEKDLQVLTDSVGAIKQSQAELREQITDVQNNTETMGNDMPAAIEQLKAELSGTVITAEAVGTAGIDQFPPFPEPSETNSVD